jgi:NAD(P)-dependent dehydrogenase (short-subunit alcohol dehydrogenase family)
MAELTTNGKPRALITGGVQGIGRGVADVLLARGWEVLATGLSQAEIDDAPPAEHLTLSVLDVTDNVAVSELVNSIDRLDGLVNCAGILRRGEE